MKLNSVKRMLVMWLVNRVFVGTRCYEKKRKLLNSIGYTIGEGTRVVGPIFCTGNLVIGKDCWIGKNITVNGNGAVIISDNCDIAPEVTFLTGGHAIGTGERRAGMGESYTVRVEDGCWIGARSTLGKEITIGKGSVVAACACVMKNVGQNTVVGGVPAKVIRDIDD